MEFRHYVKILWRWWWLILLPPLAVGVYAFVQRPPAPTGFTTALRFTAGQPQMAPTSGYDPNYYRWLTSEYIVGGLKDWVKTGAFAEAVSATLATRGVQLPAGAVAGAISGADNQRSLLLIYLSWGNDQELVAIAEAVTTVLQTQNADIFPQLGGQPATVTPLDKPNLAPVTLSLRARFDVPLKIGLGLVVGLALAFGAHYVDPFVREKSELESLGLRVVAEIPKITGGRPKT